jgi:hypothetical protein
MRYLRGIEPPNWNSLPAAAQTGAGAEFDSTGGPVDDEMLPWVASEDWELAVPPV